MSGGLQLHVTPGPSSGLCDTYVSLYTSPYVCTLLGVWEQGWITADIINGHLARGKIVGVISPEIHGRDNQRLWDELRKVKSDRLMLCTDIPGKAKQVFYGD